MRSLHRHGSRALQQMTSIRGASERRKKDGKPLALPHCCSEPICAVTTRLVWAATESFSQEAQWPRQTCWAALRRQVLGDWHRRCPQLAGSWCCQPWTRRLRGPSFSAWEIRLQTCPPAAALQQEGQKAALRPRLLPLLLTAMLQLLLLLLLLLERQAGSCPQSPSS